MQIQNTLQQLAQQIYIQRNKILVETIDRDQLNQKFDYGFLIIEKIIEEMVKHDQQRQQFTLDLLIQGTKCWLACMVDKKGKQIFNQKAQCLTYKEELMGNIYMLKSYFEQQVNIQQFKDKELIDVILCNLKRNIKVIQEALQLDKIELKDIDQYFKEVQFFTYDGYLESQLYGASSYDGKRVYFSKLVLIKKSSEKQLEGLVVDHMYQYFSKNKDPFYQQFTFPYIWNDLKLGPGDFYLLDVYRQKPWYFSPFSFLVMPYSFYHTQFLQQSNIFVFKIYYLNDIKYQLQQKIWLNM